MNALQDIEDAVALVRRTLAPTAQMEWPLLSQRCGCEVWVKHVPIGLGSGICGCAAVRDALGLGTEIVGVVAEGAPAYALSFDAGQAVSVGQIPETIADGVACRVPHPEALATILSSASRVVQVPEDGIRVAMRHFFTDCHQVAEGAGALSLAAALLAEEREANRGQRIGLVLTGGNVDADVFAGILSA